MRAFRVVAHADCTSDGPQTALAEPPESKSDPNSARGSTGGAQRSRVQAAGFSSGGLLLEQDLLPGEPFQFGDELALAPDRGEPVVLVPAKVGEPYLNRRDHPLE
jgi:hypothetical protein